MNWNISVARGKDINRDSESSGERNWKRHAMNFKTQKKLKNFAKEGESPVCFFWNHEKMLKLERLWVNRGAPWLKIGGPPSKPKYFFSPIVNKYREGKVKRTLQKGVKKILKFHTYIQSKQEISAFFARSSLWRCTFCIMGQRVNSFSKLKPWGGGKVNTTFLGVGRRCFIFFLCWLNLTRNRVI